MGFLINGQMKKNGGEINHRNIQISMTHTHMEKNRMRRQDKIKYRGRRRFQKPGKIKAR